MDLLLDRAAAWLGRSRRLSVALDELAAAIAVGPDRLGLLRERLQGDTRFLVLGVGPEATLPCDLWPADRRRAYARALRDVGFGASCLVLLREESHAPGDGAGGPDAPGPPPDLDALLRAGALALLERAPEPELGAAAERAAAAVAALMAPPAGAVPSTTPPPGPPAPRGAPLPPPPQP